MSESGLEMSQSAHMCAIRRKGMQLKQLQTNQSTRMACPRTSMFTPVQSVHVGARSARDHDPGGQSAHRSDKPMPTPDDMYLPASQAVQLHPLAFWFTVAYSPHPHSSCANLSSCSGCPPRHLLARLRRVCTVMAMRNDTLRSVHTEYAFRTHGALTPAGTPSIG